MFIDITIEPRMITDPITEDEVFDRLKARLAEQGLTLHRGTLDGMKDDALGRFYTSRGAPDSIVERHVDLQRMARQNGVLLVNEAFVPSKGEVD